VRTSLLLGRSLGVFAVAGAGAAPADDWHGYVTVASDYVFRGVSQSDEQPSLQGGLDYSHPSGFFAGLFAAGIDYPETTFRADPGTIEVDAYVGYTRPAGRDFSWNVAFYHYEFPDSEALDKNYQELGFDLYYRDVARFSTTY